MRVNGVRIAIAAALCGALATGCSAAFGAKASTLAVVKPPAFAATVTVSGKYVGYAGAGRIGLSFESGTLNSGQFDDAGDLAPLLRNLGSSVMRFGGNTVDTEYTSIKPGPLAGLARLAKASGWKLLYSEDLAHFNAARVTSDVRRVSKALGPSLLAFACGNEPDLYHQNGLRSTSYTESAYLPQEAGCLAAIRAGAPSAPLEGPDNIERDWLSSYASAQAGKVAWLGEHYYPMGCGLGGLTPAAFASKMLSPDMTAKEAKFFTEGSTAAKNAPSASLRISETNTACSHGAVGVSDAFASALWVVNYVLTGEKHPVEGFNFMGALSNACQGYTPLCQTGPNEYAAQPIYYGMLFTHMLGTGHMLQATISSAQPQDYLTAFALKSAVGGSIRLMVENLSGSTANVTLSPGGDPRRASLFHLTGPSLLATSGVRIQGAQVGHNGGFTPGQPNVVSCRSGSCRVTLAPYSAALVAFS